MASADVLFAPLSSSTFEPLDITTTSTSFDPIDATTAPAKRKWSEMSLLIDNMPALGTPETVAFNPGLHLNFQSLPKVHTMTELGLGDKGISPVAVSEPFQLFTADAIKQMRSEVLSKAVFDNCKYSSNLAQCQLRGLAPKYTPFVYDVWRSPEVLAIVSKVAGVELVPEMDFEIAHINLSTQSEEQKQQVLSAIAEKMSRDADEGVAGCPWEDDKPIVDWHTDSYPFVCVTMLSDCTNMLGGETALRTGSGEIMKVRGPQQGNAVILQGRYIEHQALRALGTTERITMVTSFRPRSAHVKDDTVLATVRAISDIPELYFQYSEYRLEMMEERLRAQLKEMRERKRAGRGFDIVGVKKFLAEQEDFLAVMGREMVDEDKVTKGYTDGDAHLLSADLKTKSRKRARIDSGDE